MKWLISSLEQLRTAVRFRIQQSYQLLLNGVPRIQHRVSLSGKLPVLRGKVKNFITPHRQTFVTKNLLVALGYYASGVVGALLAVSPGAAAPIWPPAGVALSAALLLGWSALPGILLGSFLITYWISFLPLSGAPIQQPLSVAAVVAFGAALQAYAGTFLIHRLVGFPNPLTRPRDVWRFLVLAGPVSCLIQPMVHVSSLWTTGVIQSFQYPFNWWTWWIAHTMGVIVLSPLILVWTSEPRDIWRRRRLSVTAPLTLVLLTITLLFIYATRWEQTAANSQFDQRAQELSEAIKKDLRGHLEILYPIGNFILVSPQMTRSDFGDLAEEFLQRNASIMALAWNPIVTKTQRDSFERSVRAEGIAQYEIKERGSKGELIPAHNRPEHVPVLYMEPLTNNEGVLGFDLVTDPVRIEALARARTSLKPAATGWINSPRADERHPAFALFLPVYRDNPDVPIRDPRGTYLLGYATAVFRISDIISVALKPFSYDDVELTLFDLGTPADERVVYVHSAFRQRVKFTNRPPEPSSPGWTTNVNVAGRKWLLRFTPTPESLAARQSLQSWAIAAVGLLISALLGGYLLVATGHTYEVEKFAERLQTKTQELTRANKVREEFLSVMSHELKTPLAVMTGYLEVIKEGALGDVNEEQKKTLDRIFEQADDQLTMINDILQVTLMESAKIGAEQHPVNLTELLDNLRDNYTHHENNSVRVKWDYPPDLPSIVTDRTKLKQIIQNLVNNALKYTERGEIVISAWQRRRSKSIEFKVSDTGIGISKEAMSFVFDKFWQADGSDPRSRGGIGLGLYLVKRFTELLKGEVRVQSKVGKGTTFKVSIPAVVSFPALGPQLKRPGANGGGDWRLSKELQKQTLSREDRRSRRPSNRKRPAKR